MDDIKTEPEVEQTKELDATKQAAPVEEHAAPSEEESDFYKENPFVVKNDNNDKTFIKNHFTVVDPSLDPEERIAMMARICYRSQDNATDPEADSRLIRHCIKNEHYSVLEHGAISVYIPTVIVKDSSIAEKVTGAKGHMVILRDLWERYPSKPQSRRLFHFSDPEIHTYMDKDYVKVISNGMQHPILPVVMGNVRTWRETIVTKFYTYIQMRGRRDAIFGLLVLNNVLVQLHKKFPNLFFDIYERTNNIWRDLIQNLDEKDVLKQDVISKVESFKTDDSPGALYDPVAEIVEHFFDVPDDVVVAKASAMTQISGIFTIDRSTSHQLVRHREDVSYSQESQRFVNYDNKGFEFVVPQMDPEKYKDVVTEDGYLDLTKKRGQEWICGVLDASQRYLNFLNSVDFFDNPVTPLPPEVARTMLPNATATRIGVTWLMPDGFCNLLHYRLEKHAQYPIRSLFAAFVLETLTTHPCPFYNLLPPEQIIEWVNMIKSQNLFPDANEAMDLIIKDQEARAQQVLEYQKEMIKKQAEEMKKRAEEAKNAPKKEPIVVGGDPRDLLDSEEAESK